MFKKWFLTHPLSVGETYFQHQRVAIGFGGTLVMAGLACLIHAIFPWLYTDTGSRTVHRLHETMSRRNG